MHKKMIYIYIIFISRLLQITNDGLLNSIIENELCGMRK